MGPSDRPTPRIEELPGGWTETPANSSRYQSYIGNTEHETTQQSSDHDTILNSTTTDAGSAEKKSTQRWSPSNSTAIPSPEKEETPLVVTPKEDVKAQNESLDTSEDGENNGGFAAIKSAADAPARPVMEHRASQPMTEDELFRVLSRRKTDNSLGRSRTQVTMSSDGEEREEINKLMSRLFGNTRQQNSEEERTRHHGVIFKHLTVKGMGVGAALQPSVGDIFLNIPRFLKNLVTYGPRKAAGKPPVRTLIDDFSGCVKPGEMLLVLGRPGAGCSTFLKVIGNQRFGFEEITGDVTYGGTDAKEMGKKYRSEVLYNPEVRVPQSL